ncbi:MAG: hypothetical protein SFU99_06090 [Saprospiraceae bacterium]|nr:hypothetical protein [Saprospiraceae bacterium]
MKLITTFFLIVVGTMYVLAQPADQILKTANKTYIERFDLEKLSERQLFIPMPYAGHQFLRFPGSHIFYGLTIERVDLVYTAFPQNNEKRQYRLNFNRIKELSLKYPDISEIPIGNWGIIVQNACTNETKARALPHGFLLTFTEPHDIADFTKEEKLVEMIDGDSTVISTLERNKDWKKMLVVTDLTGSMSPYTAQLLLWFKLVQNTGRVEQLVFFNDGNNKSDSLKIIGNTGGVYGIKPKDFNEIAALANQVVESGSGGDEPENNVEALLYGLELCPQCNEIIMIADNWATPRDIELLQKVNKPVRIILCGTDEGINVDYLNLARQTSGSVHTIEEDIYNLLEMSEGQEVKIGKEIFIIKNGKFELLKRI